MAIDVKPEAIRRAILAVIAAGPQPLGMVVCWAEAAAEDLSSVRVAAALQAMQRCGEITLRTDGQRWMVAPGQAGKPPNRRFRCLADGLRRLRRRLAPAPVALI